MLGTPRHFDLKYNFKVFIDSIGEADFSTCSEPTVSTGEASLWQGGAIVPIKEPARLTFADITLERGSSRDMDLYNWLKFTSDAQLGKSRMTSEGFKRNGKIFQMDRMGIVKESILLFGCWPKEYSCGDFANDSDDFRIERIVMAYDYFDRVPYAPF